MLRRDFLKRVALISGTLMLGKRTASAGEGAPVGDRLGVLVDTTFCIGCRRCEWACNEWNKNPNRPVKEFEDKAVFASIRRTRAGTFTVVNRYRNPRDGSFVYVKKQCMHCEQPGCVSACFVDAFRKTRGGAVIYNPDVCVGCRYCMIACPFDIPAYEYDEPFTPRVTKCTFCFDRIVTEGNVPACVEICPTEALRFGKRKDLVAIGHERIRNNPGRYIDHLYGEHEVGGTSWLYLSAVPFEEIGLRMDLGEKPIPDTSKGFLFMTKVFEVVAAWPLVFAAFYALSKIKNARSKRESGESSGKREGEAHGQKH